jgi:hypothetical protein
VPSAVPFLVPAGNGYAVMLVHSELFFYNSLFGMSSGVVLKLRFIF